MKEKNSIVNELETYYGQFFDIAKNPDLEEMNVCFEGSFHSRSEKYFISPEAKLWAAEANEYVYVSAENFKSLAEFKKRRDEIIKYAMAKIKPHKEHMYTYITFILISDHIDSQTAREIRRFKKYKSFLFSFHGWMHFRMIGADISENKIYHNPMGKDIKKTLLQFL